MLHARPRLVWGSSYPARMTWPLIAWVGFGLFESKPGKFQVNRAFPESLRKPGVRCGVFDVEEWSYRSLDQHKVA